MKQQRRFGIGLHLTHFWDVVTLNISIDSITTSFPSHSRSCSFRCHWHLREIVRINCSFRSRLQHINSWLFITCPKAQIFLQLFFIRHSLPRIHCQEPHDSLVISSLLYVLRWSFNIISRIFVMISLVFEVHGCAERGQYSNDK